MILYDTFDVNHYIQYPMSRDFGWFWVWSWWKDGIPMHSAVCHFGAVVQLPRVRPPQAVLCPWHPMAITSSAWTFWVATVAVKLCGNFNMELNKQEWRGTHKGLTSASHALQASHWNSDYKMRWDPIFINSRETLFSWFILIIKHYWTLLNIIKHY